MQCLLTVVRSLLTLKTDFFFPLTQLYVSEQKTLLEISKIFLSLPCFLKTQSLRDTETQSCDDKSFATLRHCDTATLRL